MDLDGAVFYTDFVATNDPAWTRFQGLLRETMATGGITAATLAQALSTDGVRVSRQQVENWRRGSSTPPLGLLTSVARVLGLGSDGPGGNDPLFLLRHIGVLEEAPTSDVVVDTAYRLLKLQMKIEDADTLAVSAGRRGGAARVMQAAMESGVWAAAGWPVVEGPPTCRMRVADRIDIRRTDGGPIDNDQVWEDPVMKAALRSARAFPGDRTPRWPAAGRGPDQRVSRWAISHVGAPKSPVVPDPKPELLTIAFTATTVDSWVSDVASLTALLIGYGLSLTRDMAIEITGTAHHRDEDRAMIHDRYLREVPRRRVWSHYTVTGPPPFVNSRGGVNDQVFHVHLVESEELLRFSAGKRDRDLGELRECSRAARDQADSLRPDRLLLASAQHHDDPDRRWEQVLQTVQVVYRRLEGQGLLPDHLDWIHQTQWFRERAIVGPLLGYLGLPLPTVVDSPGRGGAPG